MPVGAKCEFANARMQAIGSDEEIEFAFAVPFEG
jgi:hypothetical protein